MRIISTSLLGFFDYLAGVTLLLPYIINNHTDSIDSAVLSATGFFILLNSLNSDYTFSPVKLIPIKVHLLLNMIADVVLIASPFLVQFQHYRSWPFLLGVVHLLATFMTDPHASHKGGGRTLL
ncbi:MAG: hypothetical protein ACXVP0_15955 [Bacteroidia bacterium]